MKEYTSIDQFYDEARLKRSTEEAKKRGMGDSVNNEPLLSREDRSRIAMEEAIKRREAEEREAKTGERAKKLKDEIREAFNKK